MLSMSSHFFESLHKEQWQEVRLGEVAEIKTDIWKVGGEQEQYIGLEHIAADSLRLCGIGNSNEVSSNKYIFRENDILFGKLRPYFRKIIKSKFKGICSTDIWVIRAKQNIDQTFLFYFFANKTLINLSYSSSKGTRMPRADWNFLSQTTWLIPPLEVQQRIAEILSSFDDKIDLLHRQNKTLESLALTLFRHTFIDNPNRNEWEMGKLGDWIIETIGGDWGKEKPINDFQEKVSCIRGTDIADLNKGLADKTPIRYIKKNKLSILEPKEGDIIFEISGGTETQSTGRCVFVNQQVKTLFEYPIVFSNFCRLLRVKKKEYSYFLYLYLQYLYYNDEFFALENGTSGIKNLNYKALFYELEYKMPSEIQSIEFHEKVKIYFDKINANKKQIQNLQSMRDMLLAKILNEKMEV